jgi:hypothetical protein
MSDNKIFWFKFNSLTIIPLMLKEHYFSLTDDLNYYIYII